MQRELRDWGLSFDSNLLSFSGRILQAEKIHQGGKTVRQFLKVVSEIRFGSDSQ